MTFQIGDKVVYPNQGVGTIENISTRSFGSAFERFYLLRFGCNSMTVLVPFSNAARNLQGTRVPRAATPETHGLLGNLRVAVRAVKIGCTLGEPLSTSCQCRCRHS